MRKKSKYKLADEEYIIQTSCKVCEKCWLDPKTDICLYGGPFSGYRKVNYEGSNSRE